MDFATALAKKARELTEGMQNRVKRNPDIADYRTAFLPIITEFLSPDAKDHDPHSRNITVCEYKGCGKRAIFIRFGTPLCFEHRNVSYATEKTDQQFNR